MNDPIVLKMYITAISFIISLFIGLLVWLGKGVFKRLDVLREKQEMESVRFAALQKDIEIYGRDLQDIKMNMRDINEIKGQFGMIDLRIKTLEREISEFRRSHSHTENNKTS
jgi:hypothetical protein